MPVNTFIEDIVEFLEDEFGGLKIDTERNDASATHELKIEADVDSYMLLNIQDECFNSNSLDAIKQILSGPGKVILESNLNTAVLLNSDLTVTV